MDTASSSPKPDIHIQATHFRFDVIIPAIGADKFPLLSRGAVGGILPYFGTACLAAAPDIGVEGGDLRD